MKVVGKIFDDFFKKVIDEHINNNIEEKDKTKDFIDILLGFLGTEEHEFKMERSHMKIVILV